MTMSKVEEGDGRDNYEPIRRLAMVHIQPARNPSKPLTSFCIKDILGCSSNDEVVSQSSQHCYNFRYQVDDPHSPQQQTIRVSACDRSTSQSCNPRGHPAIHTGHRKSSSTGRDLQADLMSLCRLEQAADKIRSGVLRSPADRSIPLNGRSKFSGHGCPPAVHTLSHGELLQITPQLTPVNMSTKIVRPWDTDLDTCHSNTTSPGASTGAILTASEASSEEEEEITVDCEDEDDDDDLPSPSASNKKQSVSPLDALMAMTSKTFEGLEGGGPADVRRRDQTALFGKHQPPKKRRKSRTAFTNQQIYELEKRFLYQKYLTPADRDEIAISLGLTNAQVITWFQNRRAKLKRDLEELKNDVTAAKKIPLHKFVPETLAEMDLRKVQEKTLRDSFNHGGMHSPTSMASLGNEVQQATLTPIQSPSEGVLKHEEAAGSALKHEESMDAKCCDDDLKQVLNNQYDKHITDGEKHLIQSCNPREHHETNQGTHSHHPNVGDDYRSPYVQEKDFKSKHNGVI